jgi:hypothetical protein
MDEPVTTAVTRRGGVERRLRRTSEGREGETTPHQSAVRLEPDSAVARGLTDEGTGTVEVGTSSNLEVATGA